MANLAKVHGHEPETLATLATLAGGEGQTAKGRLPLPVQESKPSKITPFETGDVRHASGIVRQAAKAANFAKDPLFDFDGADLDERAAIATELGGVPTVYADTWACLQCQKPVAIPDNQWRQAIDAAGRFLDEWGALAVEFQWTPGDLFDVPGDRNLGGLIWFLNGEAMRALGPEYAVTTSGRNFDRLTRAHGR